MLSQNKLLQLFFFGTLTKILMVCDFVHTMYVSVAQHLKELKGIIEIGHATERV